MGRFTDLWSGFSPRQKRRVSEAVISSPGYLRLVAAGHKRPSRRLARDLAWALGGGTTAEGLFPEHVKYWEELK